MQRQSLNEAEIPQRKDIRYETTPVKAEPPIPRHVVS
jgi:hypothetical protein